MFCSLGREYQREKEEEGKRIKGRGRGKGEKGRKEEKGIIREVSLHRMVGNLSKIKSD